MVFCGKVAVVKLTKCEQANAEELATNLKNEGFDIALIHGDMNQFDRTAVITKFKKNQVRKEFYENLC